MYKAIADNKRNTVIMMALFVGIISAIGWVVGYLYSDTNIVYFFIAGGFLYALFQYYLASSIAIAMTGAHQIEKRDNPRLYRTVENLSITNGMPMPKVYIIDDPAPNAFATGRDPSHAIVAATSGILEIMDDNELEAVMAHEMGHVKNYDIRLSMIIFGLVSAIGLITDIALRSLFYSDDRDNKSPLAMIIGVAVLILTPLVAAIIQMAISRQREYLADATSAMTTRNPDAMVSALGKLKEFGRPMKRQNTALAHLFISNPLKTGSFNKLFSTHPPIEERINRLNKSKVKF